MIEAEDIFKHYVASNVKALKGLSFRFMQGINAIVGPNGAGKTTTIKILAGLLNPTKGDIKINGIDIKQNRRAVQEIVGYVGQFAAGSFQYRLTGRENLYFFGKMKKIDKQRLKREINHYIDLFGIENFINQQFSTLSGGQGQILAIIRALLGDPQILFLDEPTRALDPVMARKVRRIIRQKAEKDDIMIIITSQNMYEIEEIAERLLFIHEGEVLYNGKIEDFKSSTEPRKVIKTAKLNDSIISKIKERIPSIKIEQDEINTKIYTLATDTLTVLSEMPEDVIGSIYIKEVTLEESYIQFITSKGIEKSMEEN